MSSLESKVSTSRTSLPTPEQRIQWIEDALTTIGYSPDMLVRGYQFVTKGAHVARADLVAFADPRQRDIATCCIVAHSVPQDKSPGDMLEQFSYLAAPLAFVARPKRVDVWALRGRHEPPVSLGGTAYRELASYVTKNRLSAELLLPAKTGARQLSFFEADPTLLDFAKRATTDILVAEFKQAFASGREELREALGRELSDDDLKNLTQLAIRVLAARILEDKGYLGQTRAATGLELLQIAHSAVRAYFGGGRVRPRAFVPVVETIWDNLARDALFSSLTNEMLGHFYEDVLVTPQMRRELGIYYTPSFVTRQVLQRLPVEDLSPESRHVLDATCGSGSFLVAAHERLGGLLPASMSPEEKHDYLRSHLSGRDVDEFAVEVAALSLLNFSLPDGDSWNVKSADFLRTRPGVWSQAPSIIVGNPPWGEERQETGRYRQRATEYLDRYLDLLPADGLIGCLMPESFLHSRSCRESRANLLARCEVFELWQLPSGTC